MEKLLLPSRRVTVSPSRLVVVAVPTGDVENRCPAADVVLDADVEVLPGGIEDSARPRGGEIVQRRDANATIGQQVLILSIR